jgi:hypothetical protein
MKKIQFLALTLLISTLSFSQNKSQMTPEQVVQENLDFYNNRNIEGFMTSFSEDIKMYNLADPKPTVVGREEIRRVYTNLFEKSPKLHSTILKRIVIGNRVIDHESITGRNGNPDVLELVLIYEVRDQKIFRITVVRK